jgi:hypothetical protein
LPPQSDAVNVTDPVFAKTSLIDVNPPPNESPDEFELLIANVKNPFELAKFCDWISEYITQFA